MKTTGNWIKRILLYVVGLALIAVGVNIAKMSNLGISPSSSVARVLEVVFNVKLSAGITLGVWSAIIYTLLVGLQILVLRKKFHLLNIAGILVAFLFGFLVDLVGIDPKAVGHLLAYLPENLLHPGPYWQKLIYLLLSLLVIGSGVWLYIRQDIIPMPAEGLAGAISEVSGKKFGNCKTFVDMGMVVIALIVQLIFLGGLESFTGDHVVVREGTIISAVLVGQVVKTINRIFPKK